MLAAVVAMALAGPVDMLVSGSGNAAHAQSRDGQKRVNLFELLFGGALKRGRENIRKLQRQQKENQARRVIVAPDANTSFAGGQTAAKTVLTKDEDALKVLVVGDFMANGLFWGLEQAFAENPGVEVVDASSGLSGFTREDVVNWPDRLSKLLLEQKPVAVVIQIGMNDRQNMRVGQQRFEKLGDEWKEAYLARALGAARAVQAASAALIWVGLPPAKSPQMNTDLVAFNEIFRNVSGLAGGQYVDIWDGFTGADGEFISAGPDIDGQIVRLRNSDGINMTKPGKRKMAFYAERELRKVRGLGFDERPGAGFGLDIAAPVTPPDYDPASSGRTIAMSLDNPAFDGFEVLEGEGVFLDSGAAGSTSRELVQSGLVGNPPSGRIDASWGAAKPQALKPLEIERSGPS